MTRGRAALAAALAATLVGLPALRNEYALDDAAIVERNPAAHSVAAALRAVDDPYWPPEHGAGLWRPLTILSFAADYQVSGGSTVWLHGTNVVLHAVATGLLVPVLAAYVTVWGALAGALVFAAHPVHVEAVANLVGRSELMVAVALLAALLLARRVRERRDRALPTAATELAVLGCVLAGLLSKEHAVVALPLLALDDLARRPEGGRMPARTYLALLALTAAWLVARSAVEGGQSLTAVAPTFFGLDTAGRLATMAPVVFVVVRLLVWPFDLSPDYHPQVIDRLESFTALGVAGAALSLALAALAIAAWRRARPVSVGLGVTALGWGPTSNLLLPTGIVLAERALYFPSVGVALLAAAGFDALARRYGARAAWIALALAVAAFGARSLSRAGAWRTTRDVVVTALLSHPESYKVHQSAARVLVRLGDRAAAQREYRLAAELYPLDHYLLTEIAANQLERDEPADAARWLRRSLALDSAQSLTHELLARSLLARDSASAALPHAARAVALAPERAEAARMLAASWLALGRADSARAVWPAFRARGGPAFDGWLLEAVTAAAQGDTSWARAGLDSARARLPGDTVATRRLAEAQVEVARLGAGPR